MKNPKKKEIEKQKKLKLDATIIAMDQQLKAEKSKAEENAKLTQEKQAVKDATKAIASEFSLSKGATLE